MLEMLRSVTLDERGQALVEYSLALALITVVAAGLLSALGADLKTTLQTVVTSI
jgi:Flp pilus assembly pilin Flp